MTAIAENPAPRVTRLPTEDDLPYSDGMPMESNWHVLQADLLRSALTLHWSDRSRFFIGTNMFLYFSEARLRSQDFRGPDFFVALEVEDRDRKSWVVWQEQKGPDVVIELLSETTAEIDRTEKKQVYRDQVRVPEYFFYDPETREPAGFALVDGNYEVIQPDQDGRLASRRLGLSLGVWYGSYHRLEAEWLRWFTPDGRLLPNAFEHAEAADRRADAAVQRAEDERTRMDEERARADRLAARLRALGVDPEE